MRISVVTAQVASSRKMSTWFVDESECRLYGTIEIYIHMHVYTYMCVLYAGYG